MAGRLTLSILEQAPISDGSTAGAALLHAIQLARDAETWGYTRFWCAEHHATRMLACSNPEVLLAPIALATSRLRVGSGGVMLPHYSPYKVAETFGMLEALAPGRVDLGIGRAPGSDPLTAMALRRDRRVPPADDFEDQLRELLSYVREGFPPTHQFAAVANALAVGQRPAPWLLGSSPASATWAARYGLPYAFADFIGGDGTALTRHYRAAYQPASTGDAPYVAIAVWVLCAATDDEAQRLSTSARAAFAHFLMGTPIPLPSVGDAAAFLRAHPDLDQAVTARRRAIIGSPDTVRAHIVALADAYGADEVLVVTAAYDHEDRRRSYALLADTFTLSR